MKTLIALSPFIIGVLILIFASVMGSKESKLEAQLDKQINADNIEIGCLDAYVHLKAIGIIDINEEQEGSEFCDSEYHKEMSK